MNVNLLYYFSFRDVHAMPQLVICTIGAVRWSILDRVYTFVFLKRPRSLTSADNLKHLYGTVSPCGFLEKSNTFISITVLTGDLLCQFRCFEPIYWIMSTHKKRQWHVMFSSILWSFVCSFLLLLNRLSLKLNSDRL